MSQAKLTLRPPPNVDFVQGYPGIPPGPDRPQAAVKGAIEVRVGPGGVKAKWVRIELRKVETLPGGGLASTYFDFVGQSPINLWQASEEYSLLSTILSQQDFPFSIRIPESIPPSIALEKAAGIKYELIATVCIKGKKGFLRRDKHVIVSTSAPIIIDKHELHSTWPVYAQPETRNTSSDGVTLFVERTHTCYGPGDRIAVTSVVKSESSQMIVLRGFEFMLRETTVFRAGAGTVGKKAAPQVKTGNVSEQKVPVNQTLYTGMQHKAELSLTVPSHHTSTTLNAARHIDITYVLTVKALLATGKPLVMDLPIIISNWPRSVSMEAVRRIGLAPNVSSHTQAHIGQPIISNAALSQMTLSPLSPGARSPNNHPYLSPAPTAITDSSSEATDTRTNSNFQTAPVVFSRNVDEFGTRTRGASIDLAPQTIGSTPAPATTTARPRSSGRGMAPAANRLTVTNYGEDMPEEVRNQNLQQLAAASHRRNTSLGSGARPQRGFLNAEEEKRMLYERAKAQVEQVQGTARTQSPPIELHSPTPVRDAGPILMAANDSVAPKPSGSGWMSAEDEKARLFNQAREAVRKTQGIVDDPDDVPAQAPSGYARSGSSTATGMSAGAAMYSQALNSVGRNPGTGASPSKRSYPTADEEKTALRRYQEATAAVARNQASAYNGMPAPASPSPASPPTASSPSKPTQPQSPSAPIPYDALYPNSGRMASPAPPGAGSSHHHQPSYLTEKEKLRRMYEAQDAAALASQQQQQHTGSSPPPPPVDAPAYMPPSSPMSFPPTPYANGALSEKEMLRRRYEEQDAAALAGAPPPATPARATSSHGRTLPTPRAQPTPPPGPSGSRPLTAAEEKARLRALYEAEEQGQSSPMYASPTNGTNGVNGHGAQGLQRHASVSSGSHYSEPPQPLVPPPLMPKPPREYMEETLQEDRALSTQIQAIDRGHEGGYTPRPDANLEFRSFTPFKGGFEAHATLPLAVPPPPSLPTKVGVADL
ncbi:uncharacterized protein PHACADRAFT_208784 [Phanerochaete carnosa HHB-10118-sp]|uniref:Arrestin C-terminal-like domain-containing protein n=1 Tax=Phanerochaete carnosa (strain HHB-10118-sp) TaxID=650164 RepID=K5W7X5_PHACS|nr:uncharacterized protein PHACADRAFT_208784 [Phanerochaete carnosa HHB-10118-sp]EKM55270.1 hypothetical protein PHACADRAFT_208784 [Phanerochaete carnosa HHB-10118-sp]